MLQLQNNMLSASTVHWFVWLPRAVPKNLGTWFQVLGPQEGRLCEQPDGINIITKQMALLFASETLLREESETFETFSLDEIEQKNSLSNAYSSTRYRQISSSSSRLDNDEYVALIDVFDSAGQEEYSSMRFVSTLCYLVTVSKRPVLQNF